MVSYIVISTNRVKDTSVADPLCSFCTSILKEHSSDVIVDLVNVYLQAPWKSIHCPSKVL